MRKTKLQFEIMLFNGEPQTSSENEEVFVYRRKGEFRGVVVNTVLWRKLGV